jgi:hypothetical protein
MNQPFSTAPQEISTCVHNDITIKKMSRKDVAAKYKLFPGTGLETGI